MFHNQKALPVEEAQVALRGAASAGSTSVLAVRMSRREEAGRGHTAHARSKTDRLPPKPRVQFPCSLHAEEITDLFPGI